MKKKEQGFDDVYVMNVTLEHMTRAVDISIRKTIARLDEFGQRPGPNKDGDKIMRTLSHLNHLKRTLNTYVEMNPQVFKKNKEY